MDPFALLVIVALRTTGGPEPVPETYSCGNCSLKNTKLTEIIFRYYDLRIERGVFGANLNAYSRGQRWKKN